MTLSAVTVDVDSDNYCRYDAASSTIGIRVTWAGSAGGENIDVNLYRRDGYGSILDVPLSYTVPTPGAGSHEFALPLDLAVDSSGYYRGATRDYEVRVTSGLTVTSSPLFTISQLSIRELQDDWLQGLPLNASEVVRVLEQPTMITGVRIERIAPDHDRSVFALKFRISDKSLQWRNGAWKSVANVRWNRTTMVYSEGNTDWIEVRIRPSELPNGDVEEGIAVDVLQFNSDSFARIIREAERAVEWKSGVMLSPQTGATQAIIQSMQRGEPHTFTHVDRVLQSVAWKPVTDVTRFNRITLPVNSVLALIELSGYMNAGKVLSVGSEWIDLTRKTGHVALVPASGAAVTWQNFGGFYFSMLSGYPSLPSFWQYACVYGVPHLILDNDYAVLREALGKKAAIEALKLCGFTWKPGYVGESLVRDGISASTTYGASRGGVFAHLIQSYEDWLKYWLEDGRIQNRLVGMKAVVL